VRCMAAHDAVSARLRNTPTPPSPSSMIKPTLFMAAIRPAAAGSAVADALLAFLAAAALCSGSSSATGDEAELVISTGSMRMITTRRSQLVVPAMYVFGDSLVDAGNNDFLPAPAPKAVPPNGVDLPRTILWRTGRFTNAYNYNLADIIGKLHTLRLRERFRFLLSPSRAYCAPKSDRRRWLEGGHRRRRRRLRSCSSHSCVV